MKMEMRENWLDNFLPVCVGVIAFNQSSNGDLTGVDSQRQVTLEAMVLQSTAASQMHLSDKGVTVGLFCTNGCGSGVNKEVWQ